MANIAEVVGAILSPRTFFPKRIYMLQRLSHIMSTNEGTIIGAPAFSNIIPINVNALAVNGTQILIPANAGYITVIGHIGITCSVAGIAYIQDTTAIIKMIVTMQSGVDRDIDLGLFGSGNSFDSTDVIIKNPNAGVVSYAGFITYTQVLK